MVNLLSLPSEILIRILHWGGCSTILASQQTCHRMNDLVKGSMALQYTALLASAGLVDDMPVEVDLAERMKLLTMHEAAWKDSPWIPFGGHDGTLGLAASSGNLVVLFRLLNNPQGPGRSLVFHRLPSVHCGVPDFSPQMDPNGFIYEFFMDTSQNLLIYADGNHLIPRELGSDKSHPSSSTGVLSPPPDETLIPTTIRIYGDLAACLTASVNDGSFHLRIFNWKTGKLVMRSGGSHSLGRYEFLDADHIYFSSLEPLTHRSHLVVENIHSSHRTLFDFEPPECVNGRRESCYLTITPNSMPQTRADGHANRYFCSDISDQLIVFNVVSHVWDGYGPCRKQHHTFHISADAVLSYVRSRPSGGFVPWEAWGPGNVRVVPRGTVAHETVTGLHTVCGMRVLGDRIVKDRHSRLAVRVYDYHPRRVRYALSMQRARYEDASRVAGLWNKVQRSFSLKHSMDPPPAGTSYVLAGGATEMPCLVKEIPIPEGLLMDNLVCVLSENAVVLVELSERRLGAPIKKVFYHAI